MSRWIEVPQHRIYEVSYAEFQDAFEQLNKNGEIIDGSRIRYRVAKRLDGTIELREALPEIIHRVVRKTDGKVFKLARFWPVGALGKDAVYLEET